MFIGCYSNHKFRINKLLKSVQMCSVLCYFVGIYKNCLTIVLRIVRIFVHPGCCKYKSGFWSQYNLLSM